jgi:CspA family cold shock protein
VFNCFEVKRRNLEFFSSGELHASHETYPPSGDRFLSEKVVHDSRSQLCLELFLSEVKRVKGKVKWFSDQKGYGFIAKEDGSGDVFVHFSSVTSEGYKSLSEGEEVEFEVVDSDKGPKAANVVKLNPSK